MPSLSSIASWCYMHSITLQSIVVRFYVNIEIHSKNVYNAVFKLSDTYRYSPRAPYITSVQNCEQTAKELRLHQATVLLMLIT